MVTTRARLNTSRFQRRQVDSVEDNSFVIKTIRQLLVCVLLAAVVFGIARIDTPTFRAATDGVRNTLTYTIDYKAAASGIWDAIKKFPGIFNKNKAGTLEEAPTAPTEGVSEENPSAEPAGDTAEEDNTTGENADEAENTEDTVTEEVPDAKTDQT